MKKVLYSVLLVLGMSLVLCSCEKEEGGKVDNGKLEGKWWLLVSSEYALNGVSTPNIDAYTFFSGADRVNFDNGAFVCEGKDDRWTGSYRVLNNSLMIYSSNFEIEKLSSKELVLRLGMIFSPIPSEAIANGSICTTYNGVDVYYARFESGDNYWYVNNKGENTPCYHETDKGKDIWYDSVRVSFRAE